MSCLCQQKLLVLVQSEHRYQYVDLQLERTLFPDLYFTPMMCCLDYSILVQISASSTTNLPLSALYILLPVPHIIETKSWD
jgi:hypothetical protein